GQQFAVDALEERPLVGGPRQQELLHREAAAGLERSAAHQERERPGAAAQTRRLEIEEHERRTRRSASAEERRGRGRFVEAFGVRADRVAAVTRLRLAAAFDDEASVKTFAVQRRQIMGLGIWVLSLVRRGAFIVYH